MTGESPPSPDTVGSQQWVVDDAWLANVPRDPSGRPWIGKCVLVGKLGQGGMGAVYRARHSTLAIDVALKVMVAPAGATEMLERFFREAQAAAQIEHPNLVRIYDVDRHDMLAYMVMELVPGESVGKRLSRSGRLSPAEACALIVQGARGLGAAHARNMVHRDIKPDNMLIRTDDGRVKIADLGLVKLAKGDTGLTAQDAVMGTPAYMAPEQALSSRDVDARADVWALGASLYHMVTGRPPFVGQTPFEIVAHVVSDPVVDPRTHRPELSPELCEIVMHAMAKDRAHRLASCDALITALERLGTQSSQRPTPPPQPLSSPPVSSPPPPAAWPTDSQTARAARALGRPESLVEARKLVDALQAATPEDPDTVALAAILDLLEGRIRNAIARLENVRGDSIQLSRLRLRLAVDGELRLVAEGRPVAFAFRREPLLLHGQLVRELGTTGPGLLNPTDVGMAVIEHMSERSLKVQLTVDHRLVVSDGTTRCVLTYPPPVQAAPRSLWQKLRGTGATPEDQPMLVQLAFEGPPLHVFGLGAAVVRRLEAHFRRSIDQLVPGADGLDRNAELARWKKFRVEDLREVLS